MMRKFILSSFLVLAPALAFAADPAAPVRAVMDMTARNWSEQADQWKYFFDDDILEAYYGKAFIAQYREAAKKPAYETENGGPGDPFGYDVITNSQDGCPLTDMSISPGVQKDGVTDVAVSFKLWTCLDQDDLKNSVNELHFDVITENGKPVIADIHRVGEDGQDSLMQEMATLAQGQ